MAPLRCAERRNRHLFIGLNWLGDVIMSFPALSLAARRAGTIPTDGGPEAGARPAQARETPSIEVLTRPHLAPLYAIHPDVSRVWELPGDRSPFAALGLLRRLRQRDFQTVTVLPHSFRTALLAFFAGGRQRVGYAVQGRSFLLHRAVLLPEDWTKRHESGLHCHLVQPSSAFDPAAVLPLPRLPKHREEALNLLRRFAVPVDRPYAIIAPGAAFGPAKRWPPERYAELARRLAATHGLSFLVSGTSGEKDLTCRVAAEIGPAGHDIGGATPLPELIALLSQARMLIANDSGTMHLAAILGTPVVVAVGSTDMTRTGPLGTRHRLVIGESCHPPCRKPTCQLGTYHCLASITVDRMEQACREVLP